MISLENNDWEAANRERLSQLGYGPNAIHVIAQFSKVMSLHSSVEVGQQIVVYINNLLGCDLAFVQWRNSTLYAKDSKSKRYAVVGFWDHEQYNILGIIRQRSIGGNWGFLCNGQAGKGAVQVVHYGSEAAVKVIFAEFEQVASDYYDLLSGKTNKAA